MAADRVRSVARAMSLAGCLALACATAGCDDCGASGASGASAPPAPQRSADPGSKPSPMVQPIPRSGVPGLQFVIDASADAGSP